MTNEEREQLAEVEARAAHFETFGTYEGFDGIEGDELRSAGIYIRATGSVERATDGRPEVQYERFNKRSGRTLSTHYTPAGAARAIVTAGRRTREGVRRSDGAELDGAELYAVNTTLYGPEAQA